MHKPYPREGIQRGNRKPLRAPSAQRGWCRAEGAVYFGGVSRATGLSSAGRPRYCYGRGNNSVGAGAGTFAHFGASCSSAQPQTTDAGANRRTTPPHPHCRRSARLSPGSLRVLGALCGFRSVARITPIAASPSTARNLGRRDARRSDQPERRAHRVRVRGDTQERRQQQPEEPQQRKAEIPGAAPSSAA